MRKKIRNKTIAVVLSAAMTFSLAAVANTEALSAAEKPFGLNTTAKTLKIGQVFKLKLKNNTLGWKIKKAVATNTSICKAAVKKNYVRVAGKGEGSTKIKVTVKRKAAKGIVKEKVLKCKVEVVSKAAAPSEENRYYEAEDGRLSGQAQIADCENASGSKKVGNLGGGDDGRGYVTLTGINVEEDGLYVVDVFYLAGDNGRSFTVSVNEDEEETRIFCKTSGGWDKVGKTSVKLYLKAGENAIRFGRSDGYAPDLDRIYVPKEKERIATASDKRLTMQAEDAKLSSGASQLQSAACSGNGRVGNIGGDLNGMVSFTDITMKESGTYAIDAAYCTKDSRDFQITVDNASEIWMECKNGFNQDVPNRHIVTCQLEAGTHSIQFSNPKGDAPDLDEIRVYRCEAVDMGAYTLLLDLETGRYSMIENGRTKICDAYAAVRLGEELFKTAEYTQHTLTKERLEDAFGTGYMVKVIHQEEGKPVIEQRFQLYEDQHYFLTQTDIYWQDGSEVSTNYVAPLYVDNLGGVENELDGKDYFLRVPYDNDGWVKYELDNLNGNDTGYEAAAILNEESGTALVMGSLSHDTWKTGITYSGSQNQIYDMQLYGGANGALTRDQSPHGNVSGTKVSSPLMMVGAYKDWQNGMEEYAHANTLITAPKTNAAGVPIGWNSWGSVQSDINLETAVGISDYIKEHFQDTWKQQEDDVVYTVLDSYWDNLTDEELAAFVERCEENGQTAGIYWAPFVCWHSQDDLSKIMVEGSDGVPYQDIILKKEDGSLYGNDLDGAFPVDMTHPAAQKRVDDFIGRFKKAGFRYIKLDFLVHGALEGQRYDSSIQTGTQAYNFGMKYVTDRLEGQMFINLSIAPTFPYQYADGKRIACDAYYSIGDTEYTLNGLTYGFWQKKLYQYPDPDHLVVWGRDGGASEEEARSRVTSGILLGTSFIAGDNFVAPAEDRKEAESRFQKVFTNADIIAVAKSGKIFHPLTVDRKKTASGIFTMSDGGVSYVAVLNYGSQVQSGSLNLAQAFGITGDAQVKELWSGEGQGLENGILSWEISGRDALVFRIEH